MATTATQELQESFLSAIRRSQEITLQATKVWVETVEYFTPKVSYAHLPFASQLPTAHDVVAGPSASPSRCSPTSAGSLTTCSRSPPR